MLMWQINLCIKYFHFTQGFISFNNKNFFFQKDGTFSSIWFHGTIIMILIIVVNIRKLWLTFSCFIWSMARSYRYLILSTSIRITSTSNLLFIIWFSLAIEIKHTRNMRVVIVETRNGTIKLEGILGNLNLLTDLS